MRSLLACLVLVLGAGLLPAPASARLPSRAELVRTADAIVKAGVPGVSVAVQQDGRTRLVARGRADRRRSAPLRTTARFRVGSVTKPMAAVVLLKLAEQRRLRLDDPVARWVPGILAPGAETTVRQLLEHTSGFGEYYDPEVILAPYLAGQASFAWDPRSLAALGVAAPATAAGAFAYSDTNYVLAGLVAEEAGGRPFGRLLEELVTGPLGLRHTSYPADHRPLRGQARGYADVGDGKLTDVSALSPSIAQAAGAVVSDAADLVRLERALLGGRLLRPGSLAEMRRGNPMGNGFPTGDRYGLGLWRTSTFARLDPPLACGALFGHDGDFPGYTSFAFASDGGRHGFAVLLSSDALTARQNRAIGALLRVAGC